MEKILKIEGTEDTPEVLFDPENQSFSLSGRSLPEDASEFYRPLIAWMKAYIQNPVSLTEFQVKLQYFNSNSTKQILDILLLLKEIPAAGGRAIVIWWYNADDELMEIKGREFKGMLSLPFELKVY